MSQERPAAAPPAERRDNVERRTEDRREYDRYTPEAVRRDRRQAPERRRERA